MVKGAPVERLLIQWRDWPPSLATWEDPEDLQLRFPTTPAWGQDGLQGGENVTPDGMDPSNSTRGRPIDSEPEQSG